MFNFHFKRVNHAYSSCLGVTPEEKGVAHESRLINKRVELRQRIAVSYIMHEDKLSVYECVQKAVGV